jgi:hypothetical protein
MLRKQSSARLRHVLISLSLLSSGVASAHIVESVWEAGFSRVKLAFRSRAWSDDPEALQALAPAPRSNWRPAGAAKAQPTTDFKAHG